MGGSDRSRSRSPVHSSHEPYEIDDSCPEDDEGPPENCCRLAISGFPTSWTYTEVKQYIKNSTNSNGIHDAIKFVKMFKSKNMATVDFSSEAACKEACTRIKRRGAEKYQGKVIKTDYLREEEKSAKSDKKDPKPKVNKQAPNPNRGKPMFKPRKPQVSLDTFGLSQHFLDLLNIKLPLLNKVFVANLTNVVDEDKIREIFGFAGHVVDVFMIHKDVTKIMAKIEFDHPLESVQAISMFNNADLYGRKLVVQMDNSPHLHSKPLPAGLTTIGPGLGSDGEPLRGIRQSIEVQKLREHFNEEITKLKTVVQNVVLNTTSASSSNQEVNSLNLLGNAGLSSLAPLNMSTVNPFNQSVAPVAPFANMQAAQNFQGGTPNLQMLQGLLQQAGVNFSSLAALQAQNVGGANYFGANVGPSQEQNSQSQFNTNQYGGQSDSKSQSYDSQHRSYDDRNSDYDGARNSLDREKKIVSTDVLILSNLPRSVTLSSLKNKMREVGDLNFAELTDEGEAIVRFFSASDAERCLNLAMNVNALKAELRKRGAQKSGPKEQLIQRLQDYDRNNNFVRNVKENIVLQNDLVYTVEWPSDSLYSSVKSAIFLFK